MRRRLIPLLTAVALTSVACAGGGPGGQDQQVPTEPTTQASELTVTVWRDRDGEPTRWTLTCDPPGGTHPDPAGACAFLASARDWWKPVPADRACTEIYGGPQRATVAGRWRDQDVDAGYERTNGCEIARWDRMVPVLRTRGGAV